VSGFTTTDDDAGARLDVVVAARLDVSRSQAAARIGRGEIRVDDRIVAKQHRVRAGERVEVHEPAVPAPGAAPPVPPIRYADDEIVVVAKPAGLVVHPGPGHADDTLVDALLAGGHELAPAGGERRPGVVHRLDRDTSGLLVLARTDVAHARLVAALRERAVERRYLALVRGVPTVAWGRIEAPIGRAPHDRTRNAVVADGKPATTRYRVLASGRVPALPDHRADVSLLACRLETGRTHQIRVHLTELGHAVVGDPTYGAAGDVARALGLERPFLHASALEFDHPSSRERLRFEEPLPAELVAALGRTGIDAQLTGPTGPVEPGR
jgi:23S rRNA pseudouridine1911/1915/1917 synthase